ELIPQDLSVRNLPNRITRRGGLLQRSYRSQLENGPIRWAKTGKSILFTRPSMLVGPAAPADNAVRDLVEPPGIAPGSGPLITGAFIAIVRANPDSFNMRAYFQIGKGSAAAASISCTWLERLVHAFLEILAFLTNAVALFGRHAHALASIGPHDRFRAADEALAFARALSEGARIGSRGWRYR